MHPQQFINLRKLFFILIIIILAYFVFAKNVRFNPFIQGQKKIDPVSVSNLEITHDEFLKSLPDISNTIRIGGGDVVIYYDTIQQKVELQSLFLNKNNTLQIDKDHFKSIVDSNNKTKFIQECPFPYENIDGITKKYATYKFDRGFYLGIYRELLENISLWEEKYGNLIVTFGTVSEPNQEMILVNIKTNIKAQLNDVTYLLPNIKTEQHLYDFMLTDKSSIKEPYEHLLYSLGHISQSAIALQNTWKIHPKKYELRKLKWNFD